MSEVLLCKLLASVAGTTGFCIWFRLAPRHLPIGITGGFLTGFLYLLMGAYHGNVFWVCVCSAMLATLYAECMARLCRAPTTLFLIPAIITLIPGGSLYYTMRYLVMWDREKVLYYGLDTLQIGLGIAVGIMAVSTLFILLRTVFRKK